MEIEISIGKGCHSITSDNILCCNETGRVIAVFYNDYDLLAIQEKLETIKTERDALLAEREQMMKQEPVAFIETSVGEVLTSEEYKNLVDGGYIHQDCYFPLVYAKPAPQSPRISEQDAREIIYLYWLEATSWYSEWDDEKIQVDEWMNLHGRALLAKLNQDQSTDLNQNG